MNKYEIKTLQDIMDCVNEDNIENFLIDFSKWLKAVMCLKRMSKYLLTDKTFPHELAKLESSKFTWIDDDKHKTTLTIEAK